MKIRDFGAGGSVGALCLGGGGLGGVWGKISDDEAIATLHDAVAAGITLLDVAPSYGTLEQPRRAERMIGAAFEGRIPDGVRVVTKVAVEDQHDVEDQVRSSLAASLEAMRLDRVDFLLHHGDLRPPRIPGPLPSTLSLEIYRESLRPTFEQLRRERLIGDWGLTGTAHPEAIAVALRETPRPAVIQTVTNALNSPGSLWNFSPDEHPDFEGTRRLAAANGVGVMGIRAIQGGALADGDPARMRDPREVADYHRASEFRALARGRAENPAVLALRYALALDSVGTVVLGVKSRSELRESLAAEEAPLLTPDELDSISQAIAGWRTGHP